MNLSEKEIQELKEKKISIKDLSDRCFINFRGEAEVENILKMLNENICSFEKIVDKFKSIQEYNDRLCLWRLLENRKLFNTLIKNNKLNKEELRYLLNMIDTSHELWHLNKNIILSKCIVENELFQELIDKYKSMKDVYSNPSLWKLLYNKKLFEELTSNNLLNKEDLRYLLNRINRKYDLDMLFSESRALCENTPLIKYILNKFVLNEEDVDRPYEIFERTRWIKRENIHTILDLIEFNATHEWDDEYGWYERDDDEIDRELLELTELNRIIYRFIYRFDEDQRDELIEVLKNNEIAKNRLVQIVENHVENSYDFESLMNYLNKKEKKNLSNI